MSKKEPEYIFTEWQLFKAMMVSCLTGVALSVLVLFVMGMLK